jgi:HK97 gp10 family phage protein
MSNVLYIKGLDKLAAALRDMPKNIASNRLSKPVSDAAALVRDDAKRRAPVRTGKLKNAIVVAKDRTGNTQIARYVVAVRHGRKFQKGARIGRRGATRKNDQDAFYWTFVEFGTAKMAAHPFLRPAFEANKSVALTMIVRGIADGVEAEAKNVAWGKP